MKLFKLSLFFAFINFGGLYIGNLLMANGPQSEWYLNLSKAPWTPPGWVFGAAWTLIMICFSIYLAYLFEELNSKYLQALFAFQVVLNVSWNYIFFNQHMILRGLIVLVTLLLVILYFFLSYRFEVMSKIRYLLLPYLIWLCIATSLNAYVLFNN